MATRLELEDAAHAHDYLGAGHDRNARRTLWVVAITTVMMVGEIIAGYITGSMALLADGFHMATHAGALGVAALAYRFARRNVGNPRYSFGTGKVGDLAGFGSALVLGMVAIGIAVESAIRLAHPESVDFGDATIVAVIGLVVNIVCAFMLAGGAQHDHGHAHHGHDHHDHDHHHGHGHDNNMRAAYVHVLADALTSLLAIVALLAGRFLGWVWLDPAIGIVGAIVIARWSVGLMKDTAAVLLDTADLQLVEKVRSAVAAADPEARIRDLHVWRIGPQAHGAIVSISSDVPCEDVRKRLGEIRELAHVTVEVR